MLIHPWDAATGRAEWQGWLAATDRFGMLAVNNLDPARAPLVLPLHFTVAGGELLMHLARPNPVWPHLEAAAEVRLTVTGDDAYIPTYWRAKAGGPDEDGVPTGHIKGLQQEPPLREPCHPIDITPCVQDTLWHGTKLAPVA
jgi:transcriptional regulator